jgi:hypothetical protein
MPEPSFVPSKPIEIGGLKLTEGETRAYQNAPEERKADVLEAIKRARKRIGEQVAKVKEVGSKQLHRKADGTLEGVSYGTVIPLQERDKDYWRRVKGDPVKEGQLLRAYVRRTQATEEDIRAFLDS